MSDTSEQNLKEANLGQIFGTENLTETEQEDFMNKVGSVVLEAAIGRLLLTLSETQANELQRYINTASGDEDLFAYLLRKYPDFQSIVSTEIEALRQSAVDVIV